MSSRKKLSHDQKRKKKLAQRSKTGPIQPYEGRKYQAPQYAEALMQAEIGIHEADVITGRKMVDNDVEKSLAGLVRELRRERLGQPANEAEPASENEPAGDLIAWNIKNHWREFFRTRTQLPPSDLSGILRTIMSSVRTRNSMSLSPRGYLDFFEDFLGQLGVQTRMVPANKLVFPE
jgi:hypothetical protein